MPAADTCRLTTTPSTTRSHPSRLGRKTGRPPVPNVPENVSPAFHPCPVPQTQRPRPLNWPEETLEVSDLAEEPTHELLPFMEAIQHRSSNVGRWRGWTIDSYSYKVFLSVLSNLRNANRFRNVLTVDFPYRQILYRCV